MKILQGLAFISWALFTYISHWFAKYILSHNSVGNAIESVLLITSCQVGFGAMLYVFLKAKNMYLDSLVLDGKIFFLGMFHTYGMLMTNFSMSQTTASLTHMIKMSEPFCTTILMVASGRTSFDCRVILILTAILITAICSEPISEVQGSLTGILFALSSNLFFALRNVGAKYFGQDGKSSKTTIDGFATMSFGGFLSLAPLWIASIIFRYTNFDLLFVPSRNCVLSLLASSSGHLIYNIISLTIILSIFDPVQHAMLNVAKRISIVIIFYLFGHQHFTLFNITSASLCLVVCLSGVNLLADVDKKFYVWKFVSPLIILLFLFFNPSTGQIKTVQERDLTHLENYFNPDRPDDIRSSKEKWLECIYSIQDRIIRYY